MIRPSLVLLVLGLGCQATTPPSTSASDPGPVNAPPAPVEPAAVEPAAVEPAAVEPETTAARPTPARPSVVLRGRGDLDDDGTEEDLALLDDGTLVAGKRRGTATWTGAEAYWMDQQAVLRVVELDRAEHLRAVVLELPDLSTEDPPNRVQLFVADGDEQLRRVWDWLPTGYGPVELTFVGDGRVQYVEDGWTACERAEPSKTKVPQQRVTLRLQGEAGAEVLTEAKRSASGKVQDCDQLAACPMVVIVDGDTEIEVGEILRHLRGAAAYDRQTLSLPVPRDGVLHARIIEHKPEVTFLDAIALRVDGQELRPRACATTSDSGPVPAYCEADRSADRLVQGASIDLWFDVPSNATTIELVAWGHYVPTRANPRR